MVNYREILRLNSLKYTQRQIVASVHSSRNTISDVIHLAEANSLNWLLDDTVTKEEIMALLYTDRLDVVNTRKVLDYKVNWLSLRECGSHLPRDWF